MNIRSRRAAVVALLLAVVIAALGTGAALAQHQSAPSHGLAAKHFKTITVKIVSDPNTIGAYKPKKVTVHVGQKIVFKNSSGVGHTVTADNGKSFSSPTIDDGKSWSLKLKHTGKFTYHCVFHPGMHGTIIVKK